MDPAAPPPSSVPRPRALPPLWLSLTVLAVIALAALVTWRMGPLSTVPMAKGDEPMAVASPLPVAKTPAPQPQGQPPVLPDPPWAPPRPAPNSLEAQAFALVYPEVVTVKPDDSMDARLRFWPVSLHRLDDDTYVLLSVAQILSVGELPGDQLCHPCLGFYSIAYLTRRPKLKLQGVPFIGRGSKGGWGQPPELELLENLGPRPMVLVRSGYTAMGSNLESATLVELGPTSSKVFIVPNQFGLSYGDAGNGGHCIIDGTIRARSPGKSFVIRYRGSYRRDFIYRRSGIRYEAPPGAPGPDISSHCPPEPRQGLAE